MYEDFVYPIIVILLKCTLGVQFDLNCETILFTKSKEVL